MDPTPRFHTTVRHVQGRVVVVKIAHGSDVSILRQEAQTLTDLEHHGVVQIVATGGDDTRFGVATAHAGLHTLHTIPTPSVPMAARIACQVVTAIAYLHASGVCHGRMEASHVIVRPSGDAVLCGLRSAVDVDPARAAGDVGQSAAVCSDLLTQTVRRLPRRNRRHQIELADTCLALLHDHRLDAGSMAQRLAWVLPSAIGGQSGSLQTQRHFVGQQPAGNRQNQPIAVPGSQSIEDARQVIGPQ